MEPSSDFINTTAALGILNLSNSINTLAQWVARVVALYLGHALSAYCSINMLTMRIYAILLLVWLLRRYNYCVHCALRFEHYDTNVSLPTIQTIFILNNIMFVCMLLADVFYLGLVMVGIPLT